MWANHPAPASALSFVQVSPVPHSKPSKESLYRHHFLCRDAILKRSIKVCFQRNKQTQCTVSCWFDHVFHSWVLESHIWGESTLCSMSRVTWQTCANHLHHGLITEKWLMYCSSGCSLHKSFPLAFYLVIICCLLLSFVFIWILYANSGMSLEHSEILYQAMAFTLNFIFLWIKWMKNHKGGFSS